MSAADLEELLGRFVEHHVVHGQRLPVAELCAGRPELASALEGLVARYLAVSASLDAEAPGDPAEATAASLPEFPGFQTIERIGAGGMGEVYKLRDLTLDRTVAAKVLRRQGSGAAVSDFLREARAMALFSDRRIVQIFDARLDASPPFIVMEYVDGFELGRIAPSLDFQHRARLMVEVCEGVQHAHSVGLQHRDLKPSNIMVDAQLRPRILDFGLSAGDPRRGHLVGTPPYMAPEQLTPSSPIDARADVHALGVILYELLAGTAPRGGKPLLPVELNPSVPEPLQAIALTAMEEAPADRYQSAADMAADLRRWLEGRRVTARPSLYKATLGARVAPHLEDIEEWRQLRLIHPHEADALRQSYAVLAAPEDEWIVESRTLSYTQIALYLGAFLVMAGSLFYFAAARWFGGSEGIALPFVVLGLPFIGLNAAAHLLYRRDQRAVAVAFHLGAIALLPLFLLIFFHEVGWLAARSTASQLFENGAASNRQLQVTAAAACVWCGWLALRTRTSALSSVFVVLALLLTIFVAADFGLRESFEDGRWDRVAVRFLPLVVAYGVAAFAAERTGRPWFSRPLYLGSALLLVVVLELLALDGRLLERLGVSLVPWQPAGVSDPRLLDTIAAMTLNGAVFYAVGSLIVRRGTELSRSAARLLFAIAPFALLHPLGYLVRTNEYSPRIDWIYAAAALGVMLLSERRQRRSFYYAGLLNLAAALWLVAEHRDWLERPAWAAAVIGVGLAALAAGLLLDRGRRRSSGS